MTFRSATLRSQATREDKPVSVGCWSPLRRQWEDKKWQGNFHHLQHFYCEEKQGNGGGGRESGSQEQCISLKLEDANVCVFVDGNDTAERRRWI